MAVWPDNGWALILVGVGAGVLSGLFGVGSGVLIVPALALLLLMPQKTAQGTALAVMIPMALVGSLRYWRNPEVAMSWPVIGLLSAGALVGTLIGTECVARVPAAWLRKGFALFILFVAVRMLWNGGAGAKPEAPAPRASEPTRAPDQPHTKGTPHEP